MKIKPEHLAQLRTIMARGLARVPALAAYQACHESIPRIHLARDRAMRHRWDAFNAASIGDDGSQSAWLREVYTYANDDHIDTALRSIVREVTP